MRARFVFHCLRSGLLRLLLLVIAVLLLCQGSMWLRASPLGAGERRATSQASQLVADGSDHGGDRAGRDDGRVLAMVRRVLSGSEVRSGGSTMPGSEQVSVLRLVLRGAFNSAWVWALALLAILGFGIPLGILRGRSRSNPLAWLLALPSGVGVCLPVFWLAAVAVWWMLDGRGIPLPGGQAEGLGVVVSGGAPWLVERWPGFLLAAIIALAGTGWLVRTVSGGIQHAAQADHLWVGRMRGMPETLLFHRHTLRNSLRPILMSVADLLPFLLGASILGEGVLGFSGLGGLIYRAGQAGDFALLLPATLFLGMAVLAARVLGGILLGMVDPQVREEGVLP